MYGQAAMILTPRGESLLSREGLLGLGRPHGSDVIPGYVELVLRLEQVDRRLELGVVQRVGVLDAQRGLGLHQVQRRVRDVDR